MIKKIILDLEGKEVNLSVEEAERLYNDLGRVFGRRDFIPYPVYPYIPYSYPEPYKIVWDTGSTYESSAVDIKYALS